MQYICGHSCSYLTKSVTLLNIEYEISALLYSVCKEHTIIIKIISSSTHVHTCKLSTANPYVFRFENFCDNLCTAANILDSSTTTAWDQSLQVTARNMKETVTEHSDNIFTRLYSSLDR